MYAVLQNWVNKAEKDSSIEINIIQLDDIVAEAH